MFHSSPVLLYEKVYMDTFVLWIRIANEQEYKNFGPKKSKNFRIQIYRNDWDNVLRLHRISRNYWLFRDPCKVFFYWHIQSVKRPLELTEIQLLNRTIESQIESLKMWNCHFVTFQTCCTTWQTVSVKYRSSQSHSKLQFISINHFCFKKLKKLRKHVFWYRTNVNDPGYNSEMRFNSNNPSSWAVIIRL